MILLYRSTIFLDSKNTVASQMISSEMQGVSVLKFIWPFLSSAIVLVCGLLVYFFAARQFGIDGFSEYALSRRSVSLIQPVLMQGFALALTRQVAMTDSTSSSKSPFTYLFSTMMIFTVVFLAIGVVSYFFTSTMSVIFFGSEDYSYWIGPIVFVLLGCVLHCVAWAHWQGKMCIAQACVMQALNLGAFPLVAFAVGNSPESTLWWTGCFTSIFSAGAIAWIVYHEWRPIVSLREHTNDLFQYAIPRIPGAFALTALLSLPATISAHIADVRYAGFVAFGCSLLGMAASLIAPLGVVLLPHSAKMMASGRIHEIKQLVPRLLGIGIGVSLLLVIVVELGAETAVGFFMNAQEADLVSIIRLMIISAVPLLIYISLRSVLDGVTHKALNSKNCVIALLSLLAFVFVSHSLGGGVRLVIIGSIVSMCLLAVLTLLETYRVLGGLQLSHSKVN